MELIKISASDYGLEDNKVKGIEEAFAPKISERKELNKLYEKLIKKELTPELSVEAGNLRRKLVKVRTGIADVHRTQKAFFLASGKFVDAWKNKETLPVTQMEGKLHQIEKYAENLEKERLKKLQEERVRLISDYIEDAEERDLSSMDNDVWDAYFKTKRISFEERVLEEKLLEEKRLEKERAEIQRQKEVEKENERLKCEAKKREVQIERERLERESRESERIAIEEKERKAREEKERVEREKQEAIINKQREEKRKVEEELRLKNERIEKLEKKRLESIEYDLKKDDSEKVKDLVSELNIIKSKYVFKSKSNKNKYQKVSLLIDKVISFIDE